MEYKPPQTCKISTPGIFESSYQQPEQKIYELMVESSNDLIQEMCAESGVDVSALLKDFLGRVVGRWGYNAHQLEVLSDYSAMHNQYTLNIKWEFPIKVDPWLYKGNHK